MRRRKSHAWLMALVAASLMLPRTASASDLDDSSSEEGPRSESPDHGGEDRPADGFSSLSALNEADREPEWSYDFGLAMFSWPWTSCQHTGNSDRVHLSRGDVSVHSWWEALNDSCPHRAHVWAELQAVYCTYYPDGTHYCRFVPVIRSAKKLLREGGNTRYDRVTTRITCTSRQTVGWRVVVDVDIPRRIDGPEKYYSQGVDLSCAVPYPG